MLLCLISHDAFVNFVRSTTFQKSEGLTFQRKSLVSPYIFLLQKVISKTT